MGAIEFDTLGVSKALQGMGFTREQAEGLAEMQRSTLENFAQARELATKKDVLELKRDMADMESRLTKALYNALFGFAAAIAGIMAVVVAMLK